MRDFVDKEVIPYAHEWDEAKRLPQELYIKAAKAGILAAACHHAPPELLPYGYPAGIKPEDWDSFHNVIVVDELSRSGSGGVSIISFYSFKYFISNTQQPDYMGSHWWSRYWSSSCGIGELQSTFEHSNVTMLRVMS